MVFSKSWMDLSLFSDVNEDITLSLRCFARRHSITSAISSFTTLGGTFGAYNDSRTWRLWQHNLPASRTNHPNIQPHKLSSFSVERGETRANGDADSCRLSWTWMILVRERLLTASIVLLIYKCLWWIYYPNLQVYISNSRSYGDPDWYDQKDLILH